MSKRLSRIESPGFSRRQLIKTLGGQDQMMQRQERKLEDLSQLSHRFFTCPFLNHPHAQALIVAFYGEYGYGSKGNNDAKYMTATIKAGLEAWKTKGLVLDLSAVKYEWGDMIGSALSAGADRYIDAPFPTAVIISDLNREGLMSFIKKELGADPTHWLFETLEDAILAIEK